MIYGGSTSIDLQAPKSFFILFLMLQFKKEKEHFKALKP